EIALRFDRKNVEADLVLDRRDERSGEEARGQRSRPRDEILLLRRGQLIRRRVEDDEREDVGGVERGIARQPQLGLLQRPKDADARLDARNDTRQDRKSTRLNSSHRTISYAVFC